VLDENARLSLLKTARAAIVEASAGRIPAGLPLPNLPAELREEGASFVTLTIRGDLRGCIGSLEARQPLAADVQEHAVDAAFHDYRFPPLSPREVDDVRIEISVLSRPAPLAYASPEELPVKLTPGIDGVILIQGLRRATYLPQVWEQIPDARAFLRSLCRKMGADPDLWLRQKLDVLTYRVEHFSEGEQGAAPETPSA
jgi:AmmeMemoRadiSam system protein A